MELDKYYNLGECTDRKLILNKIKTLKKEGKIDYDLTGDVLMIDDLDLDEIDIKAIINDFDQYDVIPDNDFDNLDEDEDDVDFYNDYDDEFDY